MQKIKIMSNFNFNVILMQKMQNNKICTEKIQ